MAVPFARITLSPREGPGVLGETDYAGRKQFEGLRPGVYSSRIEKEGFFALRVQDIQVGEEARLEVTLNHAREFSEQVNVVYSPPAIDPEKTQSSEALNSKQIIDLPFSVASDIRYALPLLPGVVQDYTGQIHVDGASTRQIHDQIDGFDVSDPATGQFLMRVSVDALRSAEVATSRYSTEWGKGSGGVLSLLTSMGDDRFRMSATDFIPGVQDRNGLHLNSWTPRGLVSGPLSHGKAWFMNALDGAYTNSLIKELRSGENSNTVWRISNLSKVQVNLAQNNNLTASLLLNYFHSPHVGLDPMDPISTTERHTTDALLVAVKDQHLFHTGALLELGVAASRFNNHFRPMGSETYVITPDGTSGNNYVSNLGHSNRTEEIGNLFLPPRHAAGKHEFELGFDTARVGDQQVFFRLPYLIEHENGTLASAVSFTNAPTFTRYNVEASAYVQDRWAVTERWLLEPGARMDWDEIVRQVALSPRLASTYMLKRNGDTKLAWGVGIYRDPSSLDLLTQSLTGTRIDSFYDATGQNLLLPPVASVYSTSQNLLKFPIVTNSSVAFEQRLAKATILRVQFVDKRGHDIWTFTNLGSITLPTGPFASQFILTDGRQDRYDAADLTLRHVFLHNRVVFASYTRSCAHSNAILAYNLDTTLFSPQGGGPLPWDTRNRFLSWGWLPLAHKLDLAYTLDWRDGFPFSLQNDTQQVVGAPDGERFPAYFSLDASLERRITFLGSEWAVRGGVLDLTNRPNASYVNSNVDSPTFLAFRGIQGRSFVARIRLLGKK